MHMNKRKNILIGGITGGIGSSVAKILYRKSHTISGYARSKDKMIEFKSECPSINFFTADATDTTD